MTRVLFTMRDVEREWASFDDGDKQHNLLKNVAIGAGGLALAGGAGYLAFRNRQALGSLAGQVKNKTGEIAGKAKEFAGKAIDQVGGYWRKTSKGAKTFVKDVRVGQHTPSMSNTINRAGHTAEEIAGNLGGLGRGAAPAEVIPADLRSTVTKSSKYVPPDAIPMEMRRRPGDAPAYLKELAAHPGTRRATYNRYRSSIANFNRYR